MNVINFCTKLGGGAGNAAHNFHNNLLRNGYNSILINSKKDLENQKIYKINSYLSNITFKLIFKIISIFSLFKKDFFFYEINFKTKFNIYSLDKKTMFHPDIIILHSIQNFLSTNDIKKLHDYYKVPIFWYLYDMGPFTGGCHYSWKCQNYIIDCKNCEATNYNFLKNYAFENLKNKINKFSFINLNVISSSKYIYTQSKKSILLKNCNNYYIPLGIDKNIFKRIPNEILKDKFNIDKRKKIFLFATSDLMTARKGIYILKESLKLIDNSILDNLIILSLGNIDRNFSFGTSVNHIHFEYINNDIILNEIYNIADYFLTPSIEDSGNTMMIQALMSGCPFIAFNIAYASDLKDQNIGYVAQDMTSDSFALGIKKMFLLDLEKKEKMSKKCSELAVKLYSNESQIFRFKQLLDNEK